MNLRDLDIRQSYDSDTDDILSSFYIPSLQVSVKYQRLAGFFSSTSLAVAAKGIAALISNRGKMQLICSAKLSEEDVQAIITAGKEPADLIEINAISDLAQIEILQNQFILDHVKALGWMVANGLLEIKVAIVNDLINKPMDYFSIIQAGIFHQKVGILYDADNNIVSFSGSDNESASGWTRNIEEFKVFRSWDESQKSYLGADLKKFEKFWNGQGKRVNVIDVPDAVKNKLVEIAPKDIDLIISDLRKYHKSTVKKEVTLWDHQLKAIDKWLSNNKRCLFEMATGTGKTFTALGCLRYLMKEEKKLITVIACPYSHLISQWYGDLQEFDISARILIADSTNIKWKNELMDGVLDSQNGRNDKFIILTTHDTFCSKDFMQIMRETKDAKVFFIGDEVHGMWSEERKKGFVGDFPYRLGLSATPDRWFDPEGTKDLLEFFGIKTDDDKYVFSLEDAIKKINPATGLTYLTPYEYHPYFCSLGGEELERYIEESKKLVRLFFSSQQDDEKRNIFNLIAIKRQEIIKNAENKYVCLEEILNDIKDINHLLVYSSPEQIRGVQQILYNRNIIQHKFTMAEDTKPSKEYDGLSERDYLLQQFSEAKIQALVAIRCLDEGVDIPKAQTGIIMASTGNPRQYIQRRGRILRRFPGKEKAVIYDIIVVPLIDKGIPEEIVDIEKKFLSRELIRYKEFSNVAINKLDCIRKLIEIEEIARRGR